jgi:hypothetical protein
LSKHVTAAIVEHIAWFVDEGEIARTICGALSEDGDYDHEVPGFADMVEEVVCNTCNEQAIKDVVTNSLKDAGFTNEPAADDSATGGKVGDLMTVAVKAPVTADLRVQPSVVAMDAPALREQTLGR